MTKLLLKTLRLFDTSFQKSKKSFLKSETKREIRIIEHCIQDGPQK